MTRESTRWLIDRIAKVIAFVSMLPETSRSMKRVSSNILIPPPPVVFSAFQRWNGMGIAGRSLKGRSAPQPAFSAFS